MSKVCFEFENGKIAETTIDNIKSFAGPEVIISDDVIVVRDYIYSHYLFTIDLVPLY